MVKWRYRCGQTPEQTGKMGTGVRVIYISHARYCIIYTAVNKTHAKVPITMVTSQKSVWKIFKIAQEKFCVLT